jgi:hypothetical protein
MPLDAKTAVSRDESNTRRSSTQSQAKRRLQKHADFGSIVTD